MLQRLYRSPTFTHNLGYLGHREFAGKAKGRDYVVCKLEAHWWGARKGNFAAEPRDQWRWKLLIRVPDFVTERDLADAVRQLRDKGKAPEAKEVKLETIDEGRCVQMLHVGPYEKEGDTIALMKSVADEAGLSLHGRHHEIYLSAPRRVAPQKLRTILRMPVK